MLHNATLMYKLQTTDSKNLSALGIPSASSSTPLYLICLSLNKLFTILVLVLIVKVIFFDWLTNDDSQVNWIVCTKCHLSLLTAFFLKEKVKGFNSIYLFLNKYLLCGYILEWNFFCDADNSHELKLNPASITPPPKIQLISCSFLFISHLIIIIVLMHCTHVTCAFHVLFTRGLFYYKS